MSYDTENFATRIEDAAAGEVIRYVLIGDASENPEHAPRPPVIRGALLTWDQARPMLDYEYDSGYGLEDCDAVFVWTSKRVLFVGCYDGRTWVTGIPRQPSTGTTPFTVGGG